MTDELEEERQEKEEAEKIFQQSAIGKPSLAVSIPEQKRGTSYSESEESVGQQSDLVVTLRRLMPKFPYRKLDEICAAIMVGRVLHDSMLPRVRLTVNSLIRGWDDTVDGEMPSFSTILNLVTTAYEIGLGSKGREDLVILHGKAASDTELEKLASQLS